METALQERTETLQSLLLKIKSMLGSSGARLAVVSYSGSGDSGCVDFVTFYPGENESGPGMDVEGSDALQEILEDYILWKVMPNYDNEGCSGEVHFCITDEGTLRVSGDHYDYYEESNHTSIDDEIE